MEISTSLGSDDRVIALSLMLTEFLSKLSLIQGAPKRPDTFENLIEIKRVDENN